jgi:transposase-like protein
MMNQVKEEVAACTVCDRMKTSFAVRDPELKPLPIMGLFYQWGCDLCKMPIESDRGNCYVMVMIEHFSKWIELILLPAKEHEYTAAALRNVLTRFGTPAEVVTDQGAEFQGAFADLLKQLMIDPRKTPRDHPQGDSASERVVKIVKTGLRAYSVTYDKRHWDEFLPWIAMDYRISRHASLGGFSGVLSPSATPYCG